MAAEQDSMGGAAPDIEVPAYWAEAKEELMRRDRIMKRLIPQFEGACLQSRGDAFTTLARSIVGQQISVKAAQSVWNRFEAAAVTVTPQRVARMRLTTLTKAGLSTRKAEYVRDLAARFVRRMNHAHARQVAQVDRFARHRIYARDDGL